MCETRHRLVGDQEFWLRRHGAREFELAHLDLGEVAGQPPRLFFETDLVQQVGASCLDVLRGTAGAARRDGVEERNADIVDQTHTDEGPRQLKTSRQSAMRALVGIEAVELLAVEANRALL